MAKLDRNERKKNVFEVIDFEIELINEQIRNHGKSIEKARAMADLRGPSGVSGIDYARDPGGSVHISFAEANRLISHDEERIAKLKDKRRRLRKDRKRIKRIHESLSGVEADVYYTRVILRMTQEDAADMVGFSRRHFQRIESEMRDKGLFEAWNF